MGKKHYHQAKKASTAGRTPAKTKKGGKGAKSLGAKTPTKSKASTRTPSKAKTPSKKTPAKKTPAKKAPAKRTPVKKVGPPRAPPAPALLPAAAHLLRGRPRPRMCPPTRAEASAGRPPLATS